MGLTMNSIMPEPVDLTILMPCLNEAETIARCIEKAKNGIARALESIIDPNGNRDPIGELGGLNLYDYVLNNPLSWTDPYGACTNDVSQVTGGAGGTQTNYLTDYNIQQQYITPRFGPLQMKIGLRPFGVYKRLTRGGVTQQIRSIYIRGQTSRP
jgi:hypothetical protein